MDANDPVDSGSSRGSTGSECDSSAYEDSPRSVTQVNPGPGSVVPRLRLPGLHSGMQQAPPSVPLTCRSGEGLPSTATTVDLLSNAFRLRRETIQEVRDSGCSLEDFIGTGFSCSLDIAKRNLHYYIVQEVSLGQIAETCPQHIAVGIEGSSFTLGSVEEMLKKNREFQQEITNKVDTLQTYKRELQLKQKELKARSEDLKNMEAENRSLRRQLESLSHYRHTYQHAMPSRFSESMMSPQTMPNGVHDPQIRSPSAMEMLRVRIAENEQLVTNLERCESNIMEPRVGDANGHVDVRVQNA